MPDPLGLSAVTREVLSLVKEPVQALLGPACKELGGTLGDSARHWRDQRRLSQAINAVRKIQEKGLQPRQVDPSILFPLLDAGSLSTDDDMRARWESLLAHAADPTSQRQVLPSFANVLAQLAPIEARLLEAIQDTESKGPKLHVTVRDPDAENGQYGLYGPRSEAEVVLDFEGEDFRIFGQNLTRLGLCWPVSTQPSPVLPGQPPRQFLLRITELGRAFVSACRY